MFLSPPIRKCFNPSWNPKKTILNTFTTFCLLSYSKFLFISINFLSAVQVYNNHGLKSYYMILQSGTFTPNTYHGYIILALSILVVFIFLPPLFLLLYSTKAFRKCLQSLKIRWDITNHIMDIFQGWYKDGTEGTRDYRFISGCYFLLRITLGCELVMMLLTDYDDNTWPWAAPIPGIAHVMLGVFFFTVKPYKKVYMNHMDGLIFTLIFLGDCSTFKLITANLCIL